ncbi:MAG: DinB family protein [Acidobacteriia bacterium]|nr:DinB family protein [Terriglobia bacterium]
MTIKDLETLYDYGHWANKKLFNVISQLTPEQFTQPVGGSYGSIRNTMVHVLSAEWGWLDRCGGAERGSRLNPDDFPTVESLMEVWNKVEIYVREFLSKLKDDELARPVEFMNPRGEKRSLPLGNLMQHAANHGVHHRGQVALLLRLLGFVPGNVDILFYFAEKRAVPAG